MRALVRNILLVLIIACNTTPSITHNLVVDDNIYRLKREEQINLIAELDKRWPFQRLARSPWWLDEHHSAWNELDMDLLIQKLDRTKTSIGSSRFRELLKPIDDLVELEERRESFKNLIENVSAFEELDRFLEQYQEHEWLLLNLFDERSNFLSHITSLSMFTDGYRTNKSILASSFTRLTQLTEFPTQIGVISFYGYLLMHQAKDTTEWKNYYESIHHRQPSVSEIVWKVAPLANSALFVLGGLVALARGFSRLLQINAAARTLHAALIHIASMISNLERVRVLMPQSCIPFHTRLHQWYRWLDPTSLEYNEELHTLVELFRDDTFRGAPSANIGTSFNKLWKAYQYVLTHKEPLLTVIDAYGIADAYMSVGRLYKEHESSENSFSWVTFDDKNTEPYFSTVNVYNPLVLKQNVVTNSLELGGNLMARHMMLTGPHGCGKTTTMKSIAYVYILGQSILMVTAEKAVITPIDGIGTYLNITDNLEGGMSSFMAEKQRMKQLRALALNLSGRDRCLVLVDEPYAKTLQVVGEERVFNFVHELYHIPQLMMLVATHFEKPALLEEESGGVIENYQPELLEPMLGAFIRTFRILKGKASWWFEDVRRRNDFIDWLGEV